MRREAFLLSITITAASTFLLLAPAILNPGLAFAADRDLLTFPPRTEAISSSDETATLEQIQYALNEIADGSAYVWHRHHGRLSAVISPTGSFKDGSGTVCRHIVVLMSSGSRSKKTEGIACRLGDGRWQLQG